MKSILFLATLALAAAINPIVIKGNKFFDSVTGSQFYVVGVAYQPTASSPDPIADTTSLARDIALFKDLGVNTIRVYSTAPGVDHTAGLKLLADNNIYLILDVTDKSFSISNANPEWTTTLFSQIKSKLDPFLGQPGVLGFLAGNEVINNNNETAAAAFVKASIRDVKAYIKSKGFSTPVGYAATDIPVNFQLQEYLDCGSRDSSVDFYGLNTYRWCGDVTYEQTSYPELTQQFSNYHAPFIFTEYGCNTVEGKVVTRVFAEISAIYGPQMTGFLSGGLAYEWSQEQNQYGLVTIANGEATPTPDYANFKSQLSKINPTRATLSTTADSTSTVDACPTTTDVFRSASSPLPPTPSEAECQCMFDSLSCHTAVTDINQAATVTTQLQAAINYVCSTQSCDAVSTNSRTGVYGQYSACNSLQRASFLLNSYYKANQATQGANACYFDGFGVLATPTTSPSCSGVVTPTGSSGNTATSGVATSSVANPGNTVNTPAPSSSTASPIASSVGSSTVPSSNTNSNSNVDATATRQNLQNAGINLVPALFAVLALIALML